MRLLLHIYLYYLLSSIWHSTIETELIEFFDVNHLAMASCRVFDQDDEIVDPLGLSVVTTLVKWNLKADAKKEMFVLLSLRWDRSHPLLSILLKYSHMARRH